MIRRVLLAGGAAAALLISLATPAGASVPACTGSNCSASISEFITLQGDAGSGGSNFIPISLPPPPCLWQSVGDAVGGSQIVIQYGGGYSIDPNAAPAAVKQAKALLKTHPTPAGTWYFLPVNPADSPAQVHECLLLPAYVWVPPGSIPPIPPIPPKTVAIYAFNHMTIPSPKLTVNPAGKGFVNLATYVWWTWPASRATGRKDAYKIVASLGPKSVTVWAKVVNVTITANGPGTTYSGGCALTAGSRYPQGNPPSSAGPGAAPDCGVLWQAPTASASVTTTVTWDASWGNGVLGLNSPALKHLATITVTGQSAPISIQEIQSVNGG